MQDTPKISVVIVTWNSIVHVTHCLLSLSQQTLLDFEVILIDNGSTEDIEKVLGSQWTGLNITLKLLTKNYGFAVANNIGARLARGEWIILLNADAYPEPNWLGNLLKAAQQNPQYNFFSSRQIQYNDPHLLDGAGDEYHISGLAWRRYYNHLENEHGFKQEEVFGACAAAAMYRKEDFLNVGGFDEDYFSYFEDVDLSFRMRLAGGRCLYVSTAVVHHVGSASTGKTSDFSYYYVHRNLVWTFFKNMPPLLFWIFLPLHIMLNAFLSFFLWWKEGKIIVIKAKLDALRTLPAVLRKS